MPANGRWVAKVELSGGDELATGAPCVLATFDGSLSLTGTVLRGESHADRFSAVVVGGAGKLDTEIPAQGYRNVPASIVAGDICASVGEVLAPLPALSELVQHWTRLGGTARAALEQLSAHLGVPWRTNAAGLVEFSEPLWLPFDDATAVVSSRDEATTSITLEVEAFRILPGVTIGDKRARTVVHSYTPSSLQTVVYYGERDHAKETFDHLVRRALPGLDLLARYTCRVVAQNADGSLELYPIDERIPPMSRVPLRSFGPGVKVTLAPGARVLVGWDAADPSLPFADVFSADGAMLKLDISALQIVLNNGVAGVARMGDPVVAGPFAGTITLGSLTVKAG